MNVYAIAISLALNAILLMAVVGIIPFLLYISILVNIGLVWWAINMLNSIKEIESDIDGLLSNNNDFREHLERLYELEMYYGDETLEGLIDHSRQTVNSILDFSYKHSLETKDIINKELDDNDTENNQEEEEEV
jgi:hypothetical protein|tara:strand:+ start:174 stop:575 length:402 start_codon:yes stop_codon:yes gene_type:complete